MISGRAVGTNVREIVLKMEPVWEVVGEGVTEACEGMVGLGCRAAGCRGPQG